MYIILIVFSFSYYLLKLIHSISKQKGVSNTTNTPHHTIHTVASKCSNPLLTNIEILLSYIQPSPVYAFTRY